MERAHWVARRKRAVRRATSGSLVRWIAYAMECAEGVARSTAVTSNDPLRNRGRFGHGKRSSNEASARLR
jgi:hypothetical protein